MKKGDLVQSEFFSLKGVVEDERPCHHCSCGESTITLDEKWMGKQSYFHAKKFELVFPIGG